MEKANQQGQVTIIILGVILIGALFLSGVFFPKKPKKDNQVVVNGIVIGSEPTGNDQKSLQLNDLKLAPFTVNAPGAGGVAPGTLCNEGDRLNSGCTCTGPSAAGTTPLGPGVSCSDGRTSRNDFSFLGNTGCFLACIGG